MFVQASVSPKGVLRTTDASQSNNLVVFYESFSIFIPCIRLAFRLDCDSADFWLHFITLTVRYSRDGRGWLFLSEQNCVIFDFRSLMVRHLPAILDPKGKCSPQVYDLDRTGI
jgi:hypothetical protein